MYEHFLINQFVLGPLLLGPWTFLMRLTLRFAIDFVMGIMELSYRLSIPNPRNQNPNCELLPSLKLSEHRHDVTSGKLHT